jgi:hypothetical protein
MLQSLSDSADFVPFGIAVVEPKRPTFGNSNASAGRELGTGSDCMPCRYRPIFCSLCRKSVLPTLSGLIEVVDHPRGSFATFEVPSAFPDPRHHKSFPRSITKCASYLELAKTFSNPLL